MMRAKTFVADGCWATIGTFHLDNRSMKLNDEESLIVRDEGVARRPEESSIADLAHADEVQAESLEHLGTNERIKARLARLASPVL